MENMKDAQFRNTYILNQEEAQTLLTQLTEYVVIL